MYRSRETRSILRAAESALSLSALSAAMHCTRVIRLWTSHHSLVVQKALSLSQIHRGHGKSRFAVLTPLSTMVFIVMIKMKLNLLSLLPEGRRIDDQGTFSNTSTRATPLPNAGPFVRDCASALHLGKGSMTRLDLSLVLNASPIEVGEYQFDSLAMRQVGAV